MEGGMFGIGETVLYAKEGLCRVDEIREQEFNGNKMTYYILVPMRKKTSVIYVPVDNETLTGRMRHVLSAEAVEQIIRKMPDVDQLWTDDEHDRKQKFRDILISSDINMQVRLLKTLYEHREQRQRIGKKMHQCDENVFRDVENLVYEEFSYVLGKGKDEVVDMIETSFQKA